MKKAHNLQVAARPLIV